MSKKVCEIFGSSKKVATFASAFEKNTMLNVCGTGEVVLKTQSIGSDEILKVV